MLRIENTHISKFGVARLVAALPTCRIWVKSAWQTEPVQYNGYIEVPPDDSLDKIFNGCAE